MKPTVSIVYSEMHVSTTIEKILNEAGINTHTYYYPEEVLKHAKTKKPDLYLINLQNVNLDGFEF